MTTLLFRMTEETVGDVGVTSACLIGLCNSKERESFTCEDLRLGESKKASKCSQIRWRCGLEVQQWGIGKQEIIIINLKKIRK